MIKMRCDKRAVSKHIEMIIAFMLFLVFVMFLLVFVKPYGRGSLSESVLIGLQKGFEENVSVGLTSVFVRADGCVDDIDVSGLNLDGGIVKKEILPDYFYLLASSGISDDYGGGCVDFSIGSIEVREIISKSALENFNTRYVRDYDGLRRELGVPKTIDFVVEFEGGVEKFIPADVNVVARSMTRPVLSSNGDIINKVFVVRVW